MACKIKMLMRNGLKFAAGAVAAVVATASCLGSVSHAAKKKEEGSRFSLHRHAVLAASYDDNIYLSRTGAVGSAIGKFEHELGLSLEGKRSLLQLGYGVTVMRYNENYWINNVFHQLGNFAAIFELGERKRISLTDRFEATTDPASSEQVRRARRNHNDGRFSLELGLGRRMFLGAEVRHEIHYYLGYSGTEWTGTGAVNLGDLLNRKELTAGPRIGVYVGPKTLLHLRLNHQTITYDYAQSTRDSTTPSVLVGLEGSVTSRITGRIEAGVFMRSYETTSSTLLTDAVTSPAVDISLEWKGAGETGASLMVSRAPREAIFNRFYTGNTVALGITKQLGRRWKAMVLGSYGMDEYPDEFWTGTATETRTDTLTQAGLAVCYRPRKTLEGRLEFLNRSRASNIEEYDYQNNVLTAGLHITY